MQFAAMAIMFRQTNVVWAIFVTCVGVLEVLKLPKLRKKGMQQIDTSSDGTLRMLSMDTKVRRRRAENKQHNIRPDIREQEDDSGGIYLVHSTQRMPIPLQH